MDKRIFFIRLRKLWLSMRSPICWRALRYGVAPSIEHYDLVKQLDVDGIIDVGANRGQFTLLCRIVQPDVPIVAFEPIPSAGETFRRVHGDVARISLIQIALGDEAATGTLHLSKLDDSSSLLPIGEKQVAVFAGSAEVGSMPVEIRRLDDYQSNWGQAERMLMKIDVQGFELAVLRGAGRTLRSCRYVYVECSDVVLYEGQALRREVAEHLEQAGFVQVSSRNALVRNGELIQADYLFEKRRETNEAA
jgi:FkbM family methyltransferase